MIALDIAAFQPLAEFDARMERYIAELKSVPLAQGFEEVFYPGEMEARNDARNRADGTSAARGHARRSAEARQRVELAMAVRRQRDEPPGSFQATRKFPKVRYRKFPEVRKGKFPEVR